MSAGKAKPSHTHTTILTVIKAKLIERIGIFMVKMAGNNAVVLNLPAALN